jgi:chlorosome envelope protein X
MNITINNHQYEASKDERLIDIARRNHEHIGYFCGGNGICQTCYVRVLEGSDLLSPLSEEEKALLSDNLLSEGTRMACMAKVEKPGTIRVVSAVEEVKQMLETNPLQLAGYAAKMGQEALVKFPDTMRLQSKREFDLWQLFSDIIGGIGNALQLVVQAFALPFSGQAIAEDTCCVRLFADKSTTPEPSCNSKGKITPITTEHIAA